MTDETPSWELVDAQGEPVIGCSLTIGDGPDALRCMGQAGHGGNHFHQGATPTRWDWAMWLLVWMPWRTVKRALRARRAHPSPTTPQQVERATPAPDGKADAYGEDVPGWESP